ncbi:DnaJ C-terminal domain-containing protein [Marinimicrobium agarilyticum]|uniref:DnaJ C-terminal domain-containing protein n=1 Tax=Marinimicrobium agarilyticum TaxID=306546 RepID=UPI0003FE1418|nr:DnaJ C-terminal domain-containing protein [Marinimicrobium agarilyticum]
MEYKDYYKTLGVERTASQDDIKRAYRKLARKYHPDLNKDPNAEDQFKELGEAYEVLKDPEKRAAYDQLGSQWQRGQDFEPPPDWGQDRGFSEGGFSHTGGMGGMGAGDFSDFFESLFGQRGFRASGFQQGGGFRSRGEDQHAKVQIDLEDAYNGATRQITLRQQQVDDQGRVINKPRTLNVKIPKGIKAGQNIRLAGQGSAGMGGGPSGDLYLEIEFKPHRHFRLEGKDLFLNLPLTPSEAALGTKVQIPTPSGKVDLKIPAGSQSGRKLRLKERGLPGTPPGDLYAELSIHAPPAHDEAVAELYRKLAQAAPYNPRRHLEA